MLTIDKEKREKEMEVFLPPLLGESMERIRAEALTLWQIDSSIGQSFAAALAEGIRETSLLQSVYKKGKIQLVCFSFLLSGAISGEMLVKMDFYKDLITKNVSPEGISFKPENEIFPNHDAPNPNGKIYYRGNDAEYKILNDLGNELEALGFGPSNKTSGEITIYTERMPCSSCSDVAELFRERYGVKVNLVGGWI